MSRLKKFLNLSIIIGVVMTISVQASEIQVNKSLEELKREVIYRSEINLYPVFGIDPEIMTRTINGIHSLDRDDWAKAFIESGDFYFNLAQKEASTNRDSALQNYDTAQRLYNFGRWPAVLTPYRQHSYELERKAFLAGMRLRGIDIQTIEIKYEANTINGYLILPEEGTKFPLVVSVGGLDGWKEARASQLLPLVQEGIAILSLDMPGTGQSGVKMASGAENSLHAMISNVLERSDIDKTNVVLYGGSFGGYWTTLLAARNRLSFKGVVIQSAPYSQTFSEARMNQVFDGHEYLYDALPALSALFDHVETRQDFHQRIRELALDKILDGPLKINAPVLVVGGKLDSLVPVEDLLSVLLAEGGPKSAWINPNGIHMGRERGSTTKWDDQRISEEIIFPWMMDQLRAQ